MSTAILNPPDALEAARHHHAQNHFLQAAEAYRQTLETDPQSLAALLGLSLIARQSNQFLPALRMAQAALAVGPKNALAWANYGDLLLAARSFPQALQVAQAAYRRALTLDPTVAAAQYGLANTYALAEDYPAALPHFTSAVRLTPSIPEFHFAQAFAQGKLGEHAKAIAAYRRAVQLRSDFASAWLNLGVEVIADGRGDVAELCYTQALACPSANANTQISTHLNLGHLYRSRKDFPASQTHYQSALALAQEKSPTRLAEIHVAFTYLHLEQGQVAQQQFDSAWQSFQAAESAQLLHNPTTPNPEIPNVRGILLLAQHSAASPDGKHEDTFKETKGAFNKTNGAFMETKGTGFSPYIQNHKNNGALAPEGEDLLTQAIQAFQLAEDQGHKTAPSNRGNALLRQGQVEAALAAHQTALANDPHHPGVRYNLSLTQLRAGNFAQGWPNYEIRWQFREVHPHPRRFSQPRWQGEPLAAPSTLLLHAEQGLGDTIQFVRYLPNVLNRLNSVDLHSVDLHSGEDKDEDNKRAPHLASEIGDSPNIRLILEVQPPLARLIAQSLPQWPSLHHPEHSEGRSSSVCHPEQSEGPASRPCHPEQSEGPSSCACHPERSEGPALPSSIKVISQGDPLPPFTHHIPLMSLPALFETTQETVPTPIPYLFSNPENAGAPCLTQSLGQAWENRIPGCPTLATSLSLSLGWENRIPKIGLHWAGNPKYRADGERSTHLQTFLPLLKLPNIHWISLQKGPAAQQIAEVPPELQLTDACSQDQDLADTAAHIAPLDLVITTDSAVAHLAGAMGKPLWLLLPWQSDWRWMQDRLTTPWYPQARLFRQSSPQNWLELVTRVAGELLSWQSDRT